MTSLRTAHKRMWGGDRYKAYRVLRHIPGEYRSITMSKREWQQHTRQVGTANIGPDRHAPERLDTIKSHAAPYAHSRQPELLRLWNVDEAAYFKAFRVGRQACFILAGVHLATQRRAGRA